jgi:glycosyltransferase involved in cell wall biosynthesis
MLSVLIPVFNYHMEALVSELSMQCQVLGEPYEILLLDDGSLPEFKASNRQLPHRFEHVRYLENDKNEGRSASRNRLINEASGQWLWFLDCDGRAFVNNTLLQTFWTQKNENTLLSGGRIYAEKAPVDKRKHLHWCWGSKRELLDAKRRMADPVNNFLSNNFLISRKLIEQVTFNTRLNGYGYEDTLFAARCVAEQFRVLHIENPVLHEGLESTEPFISKIEESLHNLLRLEKICSEEGIANPLNSKLYRSYKLLKRLPKSIAALFVNVLKKRLLNGMVNLFWFDVYRLLYLIHSSRNQGNAHS